MQPDEGVAATRPEMMPEHNPTVEKWWLIRKSSRHQVIPPKAAHRLEFMMAYIDLYEGLMHVSPLKPSHPNHSIAVPMVISDTLCEKRENHGRKHAAALADRSQQNANGDGGKHALEVGKGHLWVAFLVVSKGGQNAEILVSKVVQIADEFVAGRGRECQRISPEIPLELGNANGCEGDEDHVQSRFSPGKARVEVGQTEAHDENETCARNEGDHGGTVVQIGVFPNRSRK
ncbi:hypothetical protein KL925_000540 [Ogataea polymorpha]|nr:hypothetical protein KL908_000806 [Ogataea polymorpha]KAG7908407.1 hypothetical protein KL907_001897 [Ogataea polymorpha]KAG7908863.1 hypothetical protein KL906_003094 [Ogataea polymorpha]KAG7929798.1 hypothetical protein KL925_000540 [Ogataea polymorpha]KAG7939381.1 hypothetical protein KL934_000315 [Ogataea polymorpha]